MPGEATKLGPFAGGLHNSSGSGEFIENDELYELVNLEVDTDGSLANRPEIKIFANSGWSSYGGSFIGTYLPSDGRKYVVAYSPNDDKVYLIDSTTGVAAANTTAGVNAVCCIQYMNRLYVTSKNGAAANGGYFDAPTPTTLTWTTVASMPRGEAIAIYRERLWIACGLSATVNTSRYFYSGVLDGTSWAVNDFNDIAAGNGQKLVSLVRLGNDLLLFKEHSTHKFTYTSDPRKAEVNEIDATIGVPAINCVVVYNNNIVYSLHDNAVYELFQLSYSRISAAINMTQISDLDLFTKDQYGLTIHRDRLFVRYFKNLYVYSLRIKKWSSWETTRKFSRVVVIPSATVGLDTAYCTTASQALPYDAYYFQDSRNTSDTGNTALIPATCVGNAVYGSGGTRVTSYSVPVNAAAALGDWVYLTYTGYWETANQLPVVPAGFTLLASRWGGVINGGVEFYMWRKKWTTGETTYPCTLTTGRFVRGSTIVVRGGDDTTVFGPDVTVRAGMAAPSVVTVPGVALESANSLVLTFEAQNCNPSPAAVPEVNGATYYYSSPGTTSTTFMDVAQATYVNKQSTSDVTFTRTANLDQGRLVGFQMAIGPKITSADPAIERFQGRLTTKTYDFDVPHAFKVSFMWGVSVATSGKTTASLTIPNATRNSTWRQVRDRYGTWPAAQAAGVKWSNNANVVVPDTVLASLGKYSRKYLKLLKKVRFRQIYFTLVFDIVTNNGIADASLRLYDLTCFVKKKETVVKETS